MGAARRVLAALAAAGAVIAGLVLVASFLPGKPHLSPVPGWVLFGIAAFLFVVGGLGFMAPHFGGKVPFDAQSPHDSNLLGWGILWDRASPAERTGVHVATIAAFVLWLPVAVADSGTVLKQRLLATVAALLFTAALGLIVVGSRPIELDEFDRPRVL